MAPIEKETIKKFDVYFKNKIFTETQWMRCEFANRVKTRKFFKEQIDLSKLYQSYMGINPFPIIRSFFNRHTNARVYQAFGEVDHELIHDEILKQSFHRDPNTVCPYKNRAKKMIESMQSN